MNDKDELFPGDGDFSKLVKKARRKSLIRTILVSVVVSGLLIFGLMWLGTYLMYKNMETEMDYFYATESIRGANVETGGSHYNYTPFSASVMTSSMKYVAGVPVPWEKREKNFSMFGASQPVQASSYSGRGSIEDDRMIMYFEGERLIEFYSPELDYEFLPDERPLLEEIDGNKVVEMAFSFDAAYGLEEVEEQFAELADWYWVDVSTPVGGELQQPVYGNEAYGFFGGRDVRESAGMFIRQLDWLRNEKGDFQEDAGRIYDAIAGDGASEVAADELAISGVVVTGSPEELQAFADLPVVRAAVLGATTDKY
ncbi:anti sigma factor C-terminal domain-containing protein [Planococcus sp. CAU13]|uniref:anti sigma factor C-terminal domain-containing protein n=1 Tax=Planococcus sp. CAU13 TaxID=1541197 RepID=UPI0005300B9E|nr:anti sigma factor C-terminal domain-containing protein [Planococcus sp. CAU13]